LRWCHLGRVDYDTARALQSSLAAQRAAGACGDVLLLLEHPPVLTVGRHGVPPEAAGAPVLRTDRGGNATYHGPGQLVGYPVVALRSAGRGVREFVARLEAALCATAAAFAVHAHARPGLPGIWTGAPGSERKLASIGLAVRRGVTLHGCALNVDERAVHGFRDIDPCGLPGVRVTSLAAAGAGAAPTVAQVAPVLARALADALGLAAERCPAPDLPTATQSPSAVPPAAEVTIEHGHQRAS
jgi:lipoate-protein ligase B